jgi:hypothetical protein
VAVYDQELGVQRDRWADVVVYSRRLSPLAVRVVRRFLKCLL